MVKSEIVIDQHYKGYNPVQFGSESCEAGHFFGPSVRSHWLLHYVVHGFGVCVRDGVSREVKPGDNTPEHYLLNQKETMAVYLDRIHHRR